MKKKNIAIKVRLYPNKTQIKKINNNIGNVRYMYNELLARYNKIGKVVSYKEVYNNDNKWLLDSDTSSYANVRIHLKSAIKNYYSNPSHYSEPTYKSKRDKKQSYTTSVTNNNSRVIDNKHIRIPKVGIIRADIHREIPLGYKLKSVTVSRDIDNKFYASLLFEYYEEKDENQAISYFRQVVGTNYSMSELGVLSSGESLEYPHFMKKNLDKLRELEQALSMCIPKSNNWRKRKNDISRLHVKIRNQREDYQNKKALELAEKFDVIAIETLDLKDLSSHNHYGKSIGDNGYAKFISKVEYKLQQMNKNLIKVDKYYPSSKRCSCCGNIIKELKISDRVYKCSCCGNEMDRDINAAMNIAIEGMKLLLAE